jgi:hypothetical protein
MGKKFDRVLAFADHVETLSKPVAVVLAAIGLVAYDFPGIARTWEEWTAPKAWYQIGTIRRSFDAQGVAFAPNSYDSPVWNTTFHPEAMIALPGKEILTTDTAVGRKLPSLDAEIETALDKRVCLHVTDLAFADFRPPSEQQGPVKKLGTFAGEGLAKMQQITRSSNLKNTASCQSLKQNEYRDYAASRAKSDPPKLLPPYSSNPPVCPRVIVWAEAQRVKCG